MEALNPGWGATQLELGLSSVFSSFVQTWLLSASFGDNTSGSQRCWWEMSKQTLYLNFKHLSKWDGDLKGGNSASYRRYLGLEYLHIDVDDAS